MITVTSKEELKKAIVRKDFPICCKGEIAKTVAKRKKKARVAKFTGLALIAGGIVAAPFTLGASGAVIGTGLTIGGGTVVMSAAELAIIVGGGVAITGILKGRKVKLQPDGSVIID